MSSSLTRAVTFSSVSLNMRRTFSSAFFDLIGTCVDWHSSMVSLIVRNNLLNEEAASRFALDWRKGFFDEILQRFERRDPEESIDITHRRVLERLLLEHGHSWDEKIKDTLVAGWHNQTGSSSF